MILYRTHGILATAVLLETWIDALAVNAGLVQFAVAALQASFAIFSHAAAAAVWVAAKWARTLVASRQVGTGGSNTADVSIQFALVNIFATSVQRQGESSGTRAHAVT